MKKHVLWIAVLSMGFAGAEFSNANEPFPAFAGVAWSEDIGVATAKWCGMEGVTSCKITGGFGESEEVKGKSADEIEQVIQKLMRKGLHSGKSGVKQTLGNYFVPHPDKKGKKTHISTRRIDFEATPVTYAGSQFQLKAEFMANPGVVLKNPGRAVVSEGEPRLMVSPLLNSVNLNPMGDVQAMVPKVVEAMKAEGVTLKASEENPDYFEFSKEGYSIGVSKHQFSFQMDYKHPHSEALFKVYEKAAGKEYVR